MFLENYPADGQKDRQTDVYQNLFISLGCFSLTFCWVENKQVREATDLSWLLNWVGIRLGNEDSYNTAGNSIKLKMVVSQI